MTEVKVKTIQLRAELAEILSRVQHQNTRATIMRYGVPIACVVSLQEIAELDRLRQLYSAAMTLGAATYVQESMQR